MSDLDSTVVASLNGSQVTLRAMLKDLHRAGHLRRIIFKSIVDRAIEAAFTTEGIEVDDDELQRAVDAFRQARRLNKADDTDRWLQDRKLTVDDFEKILRDRISRRKLIDQVTRDQIEPFFNQHRDRFDAAHLSRIIVNHDGRAEEIKSQIKEDDGDFYELARRHSTDIRTRQAGGRMRPVARKRLPPGIEPVVFAASAGDVLGPFQIGKRYALVKVERILPGELNLRVAKIIRRDLFRRWIRERVAEATPEVTIWNEL